MHIWDTCYGMQQYAVLTLIYSYRFSPSLSLSLFLPLYSSLYSRFKNSTLILWKYFVEFVCIVVLGGVLNAGEIVLSVDISRILSPFLSLAVPL